MAIRKDYDATYKILVLGDSAVGKTCLTKRFADGDFTDNFLPTIGIDSKVKIVNIENTRIRLQVWDTAGQERFRTLTSAYFRGAMGIMLVYDVTSESSFMNISSWLDNIEHNASNDVCVVIVGNKSDSSMEMRQIATSSGLERAESCDLHFYEASAKTGDNVEDAFMDLATQVKEQRAVRGSHDANFDLSPFSDGQREQWKAGSCC